MICDHCGQREATVHYSQIINGEKAEAHICEKCAREEVHLNFNIEPGFSVQDALAGLFAQFGPEGGYGGSSVTIHEQSKCDVCGLTFDDFRRNGRLGCGRCYEEFEERLNPILRRIHGSSTHTGKVPERTAGLVHLKRKIEVLKDKLKNAIDKEEYEKAAEYRDEIKNIREKMEK